MNTKARLIGLYLLQFGIWGSYLTSQGRYLSQCGLGDRIGYFYAAQGFVSLFMPALIGYAADRLISAQKLLVFCHICSAMAMLSLGLYGQTAGTSATFAPMITLYFTAMVFYFPTISLSNAVSYGTLEQEGKDPAKDFPAIRMWGTAGFILAMWAVDLIGWQSSSLQYVMAAGLGLVQAVYVGCLIRTPARPSHVQPFSRQTLQLLRRKEMAIFFALSLLLGMALQISNGFANPFIADFGHIDAYRNTFGVQHANILISLSQISELFCILLVPFFLKRFGIKAVLLIALIAWTLRFAFFATGNPGPGCWWLVMSMVIYGIAFNFFNIAGSLFVNQEADHSIRASAQGLFMLFTNGLGATIGSFAAQKVVNHYVNAHKAGIDAGAIDWPRVMHGWQVSWTVFAVYMLAVAMAFAIFFPRRHATA
ncbi:MAG: MFS transporter [Bacteroidales bacterium]|nr:MFS transporter [Bacteroidales bacterium]